MSWWEWNPTRQLRRLVARGGERYRPRLDTSNHQWLRVMNSAPRGIGNTEDHAYESQPAIPHHVCRGARRT